MQRSLKKRATIPHLQVSFKAIYQTWTLSPCMEQRSDQKFHNSLDNDVFLIYHVMCVSFYARLVLHINVCS